MVIKFRCPTCHELFSAKEEMRGARVTCPMCLERFELPDAPSKSVRSARKPSRHDGLKTATEKPAPHAQPTLHKKSTPHDPSQQRPSEQAISRPTAPAYAEELGLPVAVDFRKAHRENKNELDMTPMVDVTFLLLIFFMITAAFGLQKSYDVPAPDDSRPSENAMTLDDLESDPKFVIVRIDQYDTYHVSAATWDSEQEAPSKPDLLEKLRQTRVGGPTTTTHLLVMASEEATHDKVVTALDAGAAVGMEDVKLMTMPAEE